MGDGDETTRGGSSTDVSAGDDFFPEGERPDAIAPGEGHDGEPWRQLAPGVLARGAADVPPQPGLWRRAAGRAPNSATHGTGKAPPGRHHSRLGWRRLLAAVVVAAVVGLVGAGFLRNGPSQASTGVTEPIWSASQPEARTAQPGATPGGSSPGPLAASPPPPVASAAEDPTALDLGEVDWRAVMTVLDARRTAALTAVDPAGLPGYATPDSSAWRSDSELIQALHDRGVRPTGLASEIVAAEVVSGDSPSDAAADEVPAGGVLVRVVDRRSGYVLVDAEGAPVERVDPSEPRTWLVVLVPAGDVRVDLGWRVAAVRPAD